MKVTVCELPNEAKAFETAWSQLAEHVGTRGSEFVLLPEMPFYRWLAHTRIDLAEADEAKETYPRYVLD